jgi:apolipoprotein D and lipocalin family protein
MRFTTATLSLAFAALASSEATLNAVPSSWDGQCYYPKADIGFQLESYLGKWFQVAGTVAPFTAGCKCIQAQYALNVSIVSMCRGKEELVVIEVRSDARGTNRTKALSP